MSESEQVVPKGSEAVGRRIRLPKDGEPPIVVFVNGVQQREGIDFDVKGRELVFRRQIIKEKMDLSRWMAMYLGLWGTYRKNETIDVQLMRGGKVELLSDVPILPDA